MQSEFAAHIGLRGKYFCRACMVKGSDAAEEDPDPRERDQAQQGGGSADGGDGAGVESDTGSEGGSSDSGQSQQGRRSKSHRKKVVESMGNMVARLKTFIKVSSCSRYPVIM